MEFPSARGVLLKLHTWVGLAAAPFLFLLAVTGSALVFEHEIDRALNPTLSYVHPLAHTLSLDEIVARVNALRPDDPVTAVRLAEHPDEPHELTATIRRSVMVDPFTARVLGTRDRERGIMRRLQLLHRRFLLGDMGRQLSGWFTFMLFALSVSGMILWWPRRIWKVRLNASRKRANFDLHNVVGFYSSIVVVVIAVTAILTAFEQTTDPLVRRLNGVPDPPAPHSTPALDATGLRLDEALRIARDALPGAAATNINVPAEPTAVFRVWMKFPEDHTPPGRSRVAIDQFSGAVLLVENTRTARPGTRILNLKRSAHTGDIFGAPTRALYFLVSLGMAAQVVTGVLIWWNTRH